MQELNKEVLAYYYVEKGLSQRKIAEKFDLTQPCISKKMKKYGIDSDYTGFWSKEEKQKLRENYRERSKKEVMSLLPDRSWEAIKLKAMDLGLSRDQEEYRHSEEVKSQLRELAAEKEVKPDFGNKGQISYVLGVVDGDGYHNNKNTIGLEVKNLDFADKFSEALEDIGLNPNQGERRGKNTVWASSKSFVEWLMNFDYESKLKWLTQSGDGWKYLEGAYDSDGDFSNPGPRICSYDTRERKFLKKLIENLGLKANEHQNNIYIPVCSRDEFFENIEPVYEKRKPQ